MKRDGEEDHLKEVLKFYEEKNKPQEASIVKTASCGLLNKIKNRSVERFGCVRLI